MKISWTDKKDGWNNHYATCSFPFPVLKKADIVNAILRFWDFISNKKIACEDVQYQRSAAGEKTSFGYHTVAKDIKKKKKNVTKLEKIIS